MKKSGGEYTEIDAIVKRFDTLSSTQNRLEKTLADKEMDLSVMKNDMITFEKQQNTQIMKLNNEIAKLNTQFEEIDNKKTKLKADEEETSSKQLSKITQLSKILMAIHQLEDFCRKKNNNKEGGQKGKLGLNYETEQFYQHKDTHPDVKNKTFNNYTERTAFAQKQMETIGQYLKDFGSVIHELEKDHKIKVQD